MADFKHYRIYCETEAQWVPEWADTPPTVCPNNPAHTVRAESAAEFETKLIVLVAEPDGQGVLGGLTGSGDEMERVIGAARVEKSTAETVPALTLQCSTGHPTGYGCMKLDMDVDGPTLELDSAATGYPVLGITSLNGNTRGDIAFGTGRSSDPSSPTEGDLWYNATDDYYRYHDGTEVQTLGRLNDIHWSRNAAGYVYPKVATDDLYIGGSTPNGVWFDDGDLVLGGSAMTGTERLKVVGSQLIDQDSNAVSLDIDSEATGSPLINLQPINANTRGDIAFGVTRTADPTTPSEGDFWYESTSKELKFRKDSSTVEVRDAIKLQGYAVATTAPTDEYVLAWNATASEWQPTAMDALPGPDYTQVTSTTNTTTTSTTDVLMAGMTMTPVAGQYTVFFSTTLQHSNNNQTVYLSIYAGGVQEAYSEKMVQSPRWVNAGYAGFTQAIVTVNGSQSIELRWRTTSGTATALRRSMMIVRVS
jgi:hypothetical protein